MMSGHLDSPFMPFLFLHGFSSFPAGVLALVFATANMSDTRKEEILLTRAS
jgi:hypothetical protein